MKNSPPSYLSAACKQWFREVVANYELEPHHVRLLLAACESWDRTQQARRALAKHGLTFTDRFGAPHPRPEAAIERDSRLAYARLLRELDLDISGPSPERGRPPALRSNRGD